MSKVRVRAFTSPAIVLLAFDWPEGKDRSDFLGFAIERSPGFGGRAKSWLPNRLRFAGPADGDVPSSDYPIQKFMWWDARVSASAGTYRYRVVPVCGAVVNDKVGIAEHRNGDAATVTVELPDPVVNGIGTWFNRAVVSSQAVSRRIGKDGRLTSDEFYDLLGWLGGGMEKVVPSFLRGSVAVDGAVYHLTDDRWILPAMQSYGRPLSLVYDSNEDSAAVTESALRSQPGVQLIARKRGNFMHNKFLVRRDTATARPSALLTGSANFTTDGLTTQANLIHTFESPELADLFYRRKELLEADPTPAAIGAQATWSPKIPVGEGSVRVIFAPETRGKRAALERVIEAVEGATDSVLFCLFSPTDEKLRDAIFEAGDRGRMMFGLVNSISRDEPEVGPDADAGERTRVALYHRSRSNRDLYSYSLFRKDDVPWGFWWEWASLPGQARKKFPVYIHHKFIVIDAETDHPIVFTGSANMSSNSTYRNDENLLEIRGERQLARTYLAEFFRLYEHYRARATRQGHEDGRRRLGLARDSSWAKRHFTAGSPEFRSRTRMVR